MRLHLIAGLLLSATALVGAEEESGFTFTPRLENGDTGSKFIAEGRATELPEGAMIHVELLVRGQSRHPIRAAFMKLEVRKQKFSGEWAWNGKKLAPLQYEANATLRMGKQPPPVRRQLAKNYGWHSDHTEKLSSVEVAFGGPEEAQKFKQETLDRLSQAIDDVDGFIAECTTLCSEPATTEGWADKLQELAGRIRVRYRTMRNFHQSVVIRQQEGLFKRLINIYSSMTDSLTHHQAGAPDGLLTLEQLPNSTRILREEITSRMPIKRADDDKSEDEKDDGDKDAEQADESGGSK